MNFLTLNEETSMTDPEDQGHEFRREATNNRHASHFTLRVKPRGDASIAATAFRHDLEFVAHNPKYFDNIAGLKIIEAQKRTSTR